MARPREIAKLKELLAVQQARRDAARDTLAAAAEAEAEAQDQEAHAHARTAAASDAWDACLAAPVFAPEFSRALAAELMGRVDEGDAAAVRTRILTDMRARREEEWRGLEARVRLGRDNVGRLGRAHRRRVEEERLAELADRVTWNWSRT